MAKISSGFGGLGFLDIHVGYPEMWFRSIVGEGLYIIDIYDQWEFLITLIPVEKQHTAPMSIYQHVGIRCGTTIPFWLSRGGRSSLRV